MSEPVATVRRLPHRPPPIIPATDLGGASVLSHGRQFLLTDPTGDVRCRRPLQAAAAARP
ncbi:MAG TPA: hypothetical protein VLM76_08715 [Patescibacteria group bacterium]|nr:hypothetical protein [Patescibacteria group bacterium]